MIGSLHWIAVATLLILAEGCAADSADGPFMLVAEGDVRARTVSANGRLDQTRLPQDIEGR